MTLATEIHAFIEKYAKIAGDYNPKFHDPSERFNGPDSAMMEAAAFAIESGVKPPRVFSEWGSGCYKTFLDDKGFAIHQDLIERIYKLI